MNRLIHKTAAGEMSLCDINHKIVPLTEVPTEYLGCIHKLADYESTGYNPDFIDTIPHILQDMKEQLANPNATNIKACLHKIDYILSAKENAVSEYDR